MKILQEAGVGYGYSGELLIATAYNYADSLSASAVGVPLMLVDENLREDQKGFLSKLHPSQLIAVGGVKAVSDQIMNQIINLYGKHSFDRLSGDDRFATSIAVAKYFFAKPSASTLTYGFNFPDGLSGSPLAMTLNSPILLISSDNYTLAMHYNIEHKVDNTLFLGGTAVLPDWMGSEF